MRYLLFLLSLVLICYPLYALFVCLQQLGSLTSYGLGVLVGGLLMLGVGVGLLVWSIKRIKKKKS
jgi:hypothetical protein